MAEPFVCPRCGAVSHHPTDKAEGYCGRCHDWTSRADLAEVLDLMIQQMTDLRERVLQLEMAVYDPDPFFFPEEEGRPTETVEVKGDIL